MASSIDLELTNRCNAKCHFCPRDQTPHEGLMSPEVFRQALDRAVEYREATREFLGTEPAVSLCGLGEPLLNKHAAEFTAQVRAEGFTCLMSSNASLLDERRGRALLDAGLQQIFINVGEHDEDYDDVYKLPFERTRDNVVRFADMAGDDCQVVIVLVDHRRDPGHIQEMKDYWRALGIDSFKEYEIINRGGALFVDHMQFETLPELAQAKALLDAGESRAICGAPFLFLFVGYDGNYYLCCSDWKKEVPMGSVFDRSFLDITRQKVREVAQRGHVCRSCNLDPVNVITGELGALAEGATTMEQITAITDELRESSGLILDFLGQAQPGSLDELDAPAAPARRTIPVIAR